MHLRPVLASFTAVAVLASSGCAYSRWFVPWQRTWGAKPNERAKPLPGDEYVANPAYLTTRAVTIDAAPEDLFPWLVQMGKHRGGLYSWDFLDRLFGILDAPSADRILPEWQGLRVGDSIPIGKGKPFPVVGLEPNRWLVLAGEENGVTWSWAMVLEPTPTGQLRFVTRSRGNGMGSGLKMALLDLAAFIMVHRWLMVLKGRAEMTANQRLRASHAPGAGLEQPEPVAIS